MRHQRTGKKLGRDSAHRRALYANLASSLIEHERIKTTITKAKAVKPIAEQMITLGRRGDMHARRQAVAFLGSKDIVHKLFDELGPRYRRASRRLLADHPARPAPGDAAEMVLPRARRHAARLQDEAGGRRGAGRAAEVEGDEPEAEADDAEPEAEAETAAEAEADVAEPRHEADDEPSAEAETAEPEAAEPEAAEPELPSAEAEAEARPETPEAQTRRADRGADRDDHDAGDA